VSKDGRRPITARDRAPPTPFSYDRPATARAAQRWAGRQSSARPVTAATPTRAATLQTEVCTVRELPGYSAATGPREALGPPRWRQTGGPWLEYKRGGPYPRNPPHRGRGEHRPAPLSDLLPQRAPSPPAEPPAAPQPPSGEDEERRLRLAAEAEAEAARQQVAAMGEKLKVRNPGCSCRSCTPRLTACRAQHNEEAISKMLASIAEMEAAVVEDGLQDAKRERLLLEEQRRARDVTLRLTEALQALALLRRKYGETEREETAGSASALRDEVLRLRDTVKAEQAAAHRELHNTRAAVQPAG